MSPTRSFSLRIVVGPATNGSVRGVYVSRDKRGREGNLPVLNSEEVSTWNTNLQCTMHQTERRASQTRGVHVTRAVIIMHQEQVNILWLLSPTTPLRALPIYPLPPADHVPLPAAARS